MAYAMYGAGGGTIPGMRTNQGSEAYGYRPLVPSPATSAGTAIGTNAGNLGQIYGLAGGVNSFNQQQLIDQLITGLPGYQQNIGQASENTGALLRGQIPPDVIAQMQIRAAERGIAAPGPNANAAYLAAIGRTSLDLMGRGNEELTGQIARTPRAPLYDPSHMFITPDQIQSAAAAANLYASAPNPAAAAAERIRIAETAGLPAAARPTGGLLGVDRGDGGPRTPYSTMDHYYPTIGPYYGKEYVEQQPEYYRPAGFPGPSAFNPYTSASRASYPPPGIGWMPEGGDLTYDEVANYMMGGGGGGGRTYMGANPEYAGGFDEDYLNQFGLDEMTGGDLTTDEMSAYLGE